MINLSHTLRLCLCINGSVLKCQIIIGHYTSTCTCDRYINTFKETYVYVHACTCSYLSIIYYSHTTCTFISTAYSVCTYCHLYYLLFILFIHVHVHISNTCTYLVIFFFCVFFLAYQTVLSQTTPNSLLPASHATIMAYPPFTVFRT